MYLRAHDSKIWKQHLFFTCDSPTVKYNCLIESQGVFFSIFPSNHVGFKQVTSDDLIFSYEKWNNIPRYIQTGLNGRGPCELSLTN